MTEFERLLERAVKTGRRSHLEYLEKMAQDRSRDALEMRWPTLAASWEADAQRVRKLLESFHESGIQSRTVRGRRYVADLDVGHP